MLFVPPQPHVRVDQRVDSLPLLCHAEQRDWRKYSSLGEYDVRSYRFEVSRMEKVTVYAFTAYDIGSDTDDPRPVKATREKIKTLAGAVIIEASAQEVDASLLDGQGYYRAPRQTP